ncbi:hypothetical protein RJ640_025908 [Escallonia rubra]|uniref:non-specific serine/threonine protein kinase n=1 Tax=Escallonia rubra TaxID=112253 RepID=A0AA88QPG5_9ASTE|nr:hypothetical protein RJ640_025908 [Escallonia rubra]
MEVVDMQRKYYFILCQFSALLLFMFLCIHPASTESNLVATALAGAGNDSDILALLAFKNSISPEPLNVLSSWNDSIHFCDWKGVSCSTRHYGRVTVLNFEGEKLSGSLSPTIANLSFLRVINLANNNFQGDIPPQVGRLSRLRHLDLSNNAFGGKIPSNLSYCSELRIVDLTYNKLVGGIPYQLTSLATKQLTFFGVSMNNLTGSIPLWLGNASSLTQLSMGYNKFQGSIPVQIGRLSKLKLLQLGGNHLSGPIPTPIYNLSSLLYLDVSENQLTGRIHPDIGSTLSNLLGLYVSLNHFMGPIPVSLSNASGLEDLNISANSFTGTVPANLGSLRALERLSLSGNQLGIMEPDGLSFLNSLPNCSRLQILDIGQNRFKGKLPASVSNFSTALHQLIAGNNQISGNIPEAIEKLVGLQRLVMSRNSITGEMPAGIGKLKQLVDLRLFDNKISGVIPSSIGNLTQLRRLYLHTNNFGGNIPSSLGNCEQLELLRLFNNNLTGVIPREVASLSSITLSFNLAQNSLTGPLPSEVGNMSHLLDFDISQNRLSGEIPSTISNCLMLEQLRMGNNLLDGPIPSAFSTLKSLQVLDLSRNNFSGEIPLYLQTLIFLQNLNLSFNNLKGEVPHEGVFRNASAFSIVGNGKLCGGIKSLGLPACAIQVPNKNGSQLALKVAIPLAISFAILLTCFFLTWRRLNKKGTKTSTMLPLEEQFPKISYAELSKATNQFSPSNLIGEGSYGSVYRGILHTDGMIVAVKVLNLKQKGAAKSFMAECNALRNMRHRNLVKIITTCSSIDSRGADFKALVFEFMSNGSLEELLHRIKYEPQNHRILSLKQRLGMAMDVASGLVYLHHECQTPIIHGDLKPSNILLDHNMTAHLGDFGLAKCVSDSLQADSWQNQASSTGIKGTIGYVAPEYGMGGNASIQGDTYAFGILLLEMVTGRRPTDSIFTDGMNIHQFAKMAISGGVSEIVDPSLLSEARDEDNNDPNVGRSKRRSILAEECLATLLKIGVSCSMESAEERMGVRDAQAELHKVNDRFFSVRI